MWAKNRLSAAAAIAVQINPSTRAGLAVSKACRLAYDFHSLNSNSTCHLHLYARQITSRGYRCGWQVRQEIAEALGPRVPAEDQPQAQGVSVDLPLHPEFDPLAFGEFGVDGLERLITQRAQPFPVFAKRLERPADSSRLWPG